MLQQEAVERAWAIIRSRSIDVEGVESAKRSAAGTLPGNTDKWIVRFGKKTDPDTVDSVDSVVVEVNDTSGEAAIVAGL